MFPGLEHHPQPPATRTYLHEVVDGLQVGQVIVIDVHADAEVEACIASVDDLKVPELQAERLSATRPRTQRAARGACWGQYIQFFIPLMVPEALLYVSGPALGTQW